MSGEALYIFAGGGTGGHIFPALAIAERLGSGVRGGTKHPESLFLVSSRPLDAQILTKEGVRFRAIPAQPIGARPRAMLRFLRSWGPAVRAARAAIRGARAEGKRPVLVAMGGFVAAPAAQAARAEGVPVVLVNMDAIPGKANRWIARRATRIVTSARPGVSVPRGPWEGVPPIVREAALTGLDAAGCRAKLGLDPAKPTLLVTGASQGARSINRLLMKLVAENAGAFRSWQVVHQTGANEDAEVAAAYAAAGVPALVRPFFDGMGLAWGAADLAVSRAGAGSVAEAWANHTPTVFMPYPYHKDQHQKFNAAPLADAGGAVIATDRIDEAANAGDAGKTILGLMGSAPKRAAMRAALVKLGAADGADRIARVLREMAGE